MVHSSNFSLLLIQPTFSKALVYVLNCWLIVVFKRNEYVKFTIQTPIIWYLYVWLFINNYFSAFIYPRHILLLDRISPDNYNCTYYDIRVHKDQLYSCSDILFPMNRCKLKCTKDDQFYHFMSLYQFSSLRVYLLYVNEPIKWFFCDSCGYEGNKHCRKIHTPNSGVCLVFFWNESNVNLHNPYETS